MSNLFEGYTIVVLDSTFFSTSFTQELKESLSKVQVYISGTFNTEIEEYRHVLSEERKRVYSENFDYINKNIILKTMNFSSTGGKADKLNNDIWGLINLMVEFNKQFNAKIAIITANRVLMEKIILYGINADYYDLNKQMFVYKKDYSSMKNAISFHEITSTGTPNDVRATEGSTVYLDHNRSVILGEEITSGLEATLYAVSNDKSRIVKVFKKDKLSATKLKNIRTIAGIDDDLKIEWAKFPLEVVYFDSSRKIPIGFIENRISAGENLDDNSLYWGDPFSIDDNYLSKKISYSIDICLKVVRQVCYLNSYGFFISDFNMGNFAVSQMSSDMIQMWDTDSFGYLNFFGRYLSPEYKECKNHTPYDISKKEGAIAISEDALHQFVFKVLALGDSPISESKKTFKYDNSEYASIVRKSFFPSNIWNYLADVFRGNKEPSLEMLLYELSTALKRLKQYPNEDKSVKQLFTEVIPGYIETLNNSEVSIEPEPVSSNTNYPGTGPNTTNVASGMTSQQVPIKKNSLEKRFFNIVIWVIWVIIVYFLFAWFGRHELPWETDVWNSIFNNQTQTESTEGVDESSQTSSKNDVNDNDYHVSESIENKVICYVLDDIYTVKLNC